MHNFLIMYSYGNGSMGRLPPSSVTREQMRVLKD